MELEEPELEDSNLMPLVSELHDDDMSTWRHRMLGFQRASLVLAHCFALLSVLMVIIWIVNLGGLSWQQGQSKLVFNWHPLMMIVAFSFMTVASLSFRYRGLGTRKLAKLLHGISWATAAVCLIIGLIAVFRSHNDKVSGYIANLYSFHSWVGVLVITMYTIQFFAGLFSFGIAPPSVTPSFKAKMLQIHHFFGPVIYFAMLLTIMLGIQEKEGFVGCGYKVTEADLTPWKNLDKIPVSCRLSHTAGLLVFLTGICTMFALHQLDRSTHRQHVSF